MKFVNVSGESMILKEKPHKDIKVSTLAWTLLKDMNNVLSLVRVGTAERRSCRPGNGNAAA